MSKTLIIIVFHISLIFVNSELNFLQLPFEHDWRDKLPFCFDNIQEILHEECHASYAFAVTEALRSRICIKTIGKIRNPLSIQELLSCGVDSIHACVERSPLDSLKYIESNGITFDECFKFNSHSGIIPICNIDKTCLEKRGKIYVKNIQQDNLNLSGPIMQEILFNGPVIATIDHYEDLNEYKEGVYVHKYGNYLGKYSVVILGYNNYDFNEGYWIAKSNFGSNWGEKGFFKIKFGEVNVELDIIASDFNLKQKSLRKNGMEN